MLIWVNNVGYLQIFIEFQCQDYVILHVTDEQIDMHYSDCNLELLAFSMLHSAVTK